MGANAFAVRQANNPYSADLWYPIPECYGQTINNFAQPAGILHAMPWVARRTGLLNLLSVGVTIAGGGGSLFRFGLYDADQDRAFPTSLLFQSGAEDGTVAAVHSLATAIPVIAGHLYFGVYTCNAAAPQPTVRSYNGSVFGFFGIDPATMSNTLMAFRVPFAFAALPVAWPGGATTMLTTTQYPILAARYA